MNVEAPLARRVQNSLRQDQTVGNHNRHIGVQRCKLGLLLRILQADRVAHLKPQRLRPGVNRRGSVLLAAPRWARWLTINGSNIMPRLNQRIEHRDREIRCPHKNNTHLSPLHSEFAHPKQALTWGNPD